MQGGGFGGGRGMAGGRAGSPIARLRSSIDADSDLLESKLYDNRVLKRLPKYMKMFKANFGLGIVGTLTRSFAMIAMPYLVKVCIDSYIANGDLNGITLIAAAYIGASLLLWIGQYTEILNLALAGQGILFKLRTGMFNHLQKLSMSFFDHNKVGKLMSRVQNDVDQLQMMVTQDIINILSNILTLAGITAVMISMNAKLALITLCVVPVLVLTIYILQTYLRKAFLKVRQAISVVNDQLQEGISGVRVTQSMSREETNLKQFDSVNKAHLDANVKAAKLQAIMMPIVEILTNCSFALVLIFGGIQVIEGRMGIGVLLAFLLYIQRFFAPVIEIVMLYTELQRAMASGARIFELLDVKPELEDSPDAIELPQIKGEVLFRNVSFAYEPGNDVLKNIDLMIPPGETVAIVGRTGAGKSSLTSLIARFYDVTDGEVLIDGQNVKSVTQESLRQQIGIVPQDPFLFSGTIDENIRYGRLDAKQEDIIKAADAAGAHEFIKRLKKGYDTNVGERGGNLSAGQRQLICLARAILANPRILILDEATSSVDSNTERIMQESLREISQGRTCIIIAHRLSTVTNANRIIVLERGKIIETGSHSDLMEKQGLYFKMFEKLSAADSQPALVGV